MAANIFTPNLEAVTHDTKFHFRGVANESDIPGLRINHWGKIGLLSGALLLTTGCLVPSFHTARTVEIEVRDKVTMAPIPKAS